MVDVDAHNSGNPHVVVYAPAETLTCSVCGAQYVSRGRYDPGICYSCEANMKAANAPLVGGPLGR